MPEALRLCERQLEPAPYLNCGRYRHYKGGIYRVVGLGRLEQTPNRFMVIYISEETGISWLRDYDDFFSFVEVEGKQEPRFTLVEAWKI